MGNFIEVFDWSVPFILMDIAGIAVKIMKQKERLLGVDHTKRDHIGFDSG